MEEAEFWVRLEFRICEELRGFDDKQLRRNWCDGLVAEEYEFLSQEPGIRGRAWCGPSGQESWGFRLLLDPTTHSREDINWSALLPGDGLTGWLSLDPRHRAMTIDPLRGYPDGNSSSGR